MSASENKDDMKLKMRKKQSQIRQRKEKCSEEVFDDQQLIQVEYMQMRSNLINVEDQAQFEGMVQAMKDSWEEAEEKSLQGEPEE